MTDPSISDARFIRAALRYQVDGEIEIDPDAKVSRNEAIGESNGCYVQAWVWVDNEEA